MESPKNNSLIQFIKEQCMERLRPITPAEEELIRECLKRKTYDQMNEIEDAFEGYSFNFIRTIVAPRLWKDLTKVFGQDITKIKLRSVVERAMEKSQSFEPVGMIFKERYEVIEVINKEEYSRIYVAKDLVLNDEKCILKQLMGANNIKINENRINRELNGLYQLGCHCQIPGYRDHFKKNNSFFLAYKYVEGESLNKRLPENKNSEPWTQEEVINLLLSLLKVLEFVQRQKMIHRDIKPSHLIQSPNGKKIYLINFANIKNLLQINHRTYGYGVSKDYSAPEQSVGVPRTNSDLYATGMVGLQALSGIPPKKFPPQGDPKTLLWPKLKDIKISEELVDILQNLTHYDYNKRYQTATEALQDLRKLQISLGMN